MRGAVQAVLGVMGLIALALAMRVGSSVRHDDWSRLLDLESFGSDIFAAAFMGSWGWITLLVSGRTKSHFVEWALVAVGIAYFAYVTWVSFEIVAYGNSTAPIGFFFVPIFATIFMLPVIAAAVWFDKRPDGAS